MKVNGREYTWREGLTILDLLNQLDYKHPGIIVSVNNEIVFKDNYQTFLQPADHVKVIHPICGG